MARITIAQVSADVAVLAQAVAGLTAVVQAQHATPAAVATSVVEAPKAGKGKGKGKGKAATAAPAATGVTKVYVTYRNQDGKAGRCTEAQFAVRLAGAQRIGRTLTVVKREAEVVAPKATTGKAPKASKGGFDNRTLATALREAGKGDRVTNTDAWKRVQADAKATSIEKAVKRA